MKIVVRLQCGVCGALFLAREIEKARKHEKACKTAKEISEKGLVIKWSSSLDKSIILEWIKNQECGHEEWVERVYGLDPDGASLCAAFWKNRIIGVLMFEHAWIPLEQEYYNCLVGIFTAKEDEQPIHRVVENRLDELFENCKLD
ncbi:MAG: hypothetical protein WC514_00660 [Candidatus Paceibacterota bacterium]